MCIRDRNPHCSMAMSAESFTGNDNVFIRVKNSRAGRKAPNKQTNKQIYNVLTFGNFKGQISSSSLIFIILDAFERIVKINLLKDGFVVVCVFVVFFCVCCFICSFIYVIYLRVRTLSYVTKMPPPLIRYIPPSSFVHYSPN